MTLFNLHTCELHHKRTQKTFQDHSFLFDHVGSELLGRIQEIKKDFMTILDVSLYSLESLQKLYEGSPHTSFLHHPSLHGELPFSESSFDLILSCLHAHWINDLPAFLRNIYRCLSSEGVFLGALWGGNTLYELRESFLQAELSLKGGASPRIAPMVQPSDVPLLLGRAGFAMPVVDAETIKVTYPSLLSLMKDLQGMGENNKLQDRLKTFTLRRLFKKAEEIYQTSFGDSEGKLPATFEVFYLTGWKK